MRLASCSLVALLALAACAHPALYANTAAPVLTSEAPPSAPAPTHTTDTPRFVELHGTGSMVCARTREGALWCWGWTALPGDAAMVRRPLPTRVEGLPPLAGFMLVGRVIVGWDRDGALSLVARDPFGRGESTVAVHHALPVVRRVEQPGVHHAGEPERVTVAQGRDVCLTTTDGALFCATPADLPDAVHFVAMPFRARAPGIGPCAIDADGLAVAFDILGALPNASQTMRSSAPIRIPSSGPVSAVVCGQLADPITRLADIEACTLDSNGVPRCTNASVEARMNALREGHAVTSFDGTIGRELRCITRDDGQARCASDHANLETLASPLVGRDARGGVSLSVEPRGCLLDGEGVVQCWGRVGDASRGDGLAEDDLTPPVHLPAFDDADLIGSAGYGGSVCVHRANNELRCFGGHVVRNMFEPQTATLPLSEPIDRIEGSTPVCVRGASSHRWSCADLGTAFVTSHGPWQQLDPAVRDVAVSGGLGIIAMLANGTQQVAFERSTPQPLRLTRTTWFPGRVSTMLSLSAALRPNGNAVILSPQYTVGFVRSAFREIEGPVSAASSRCALTGSTLRCGDDEGPWTPVAENVVSLDGMNQALNRDGEVLVANDRAHPGHGYHAIAGLPPMMAIGGLCGISREHQVWCWGGVIDRGGPRATLDPVPVVLRAEGR